MKKNAQLIVILTIFGFGFFIYFYTRNPGNSSIEEGGLAPDFTLQREDGRNLKLSNYRGRVVIINFWATWCTPCIAEIPSLNKLALQFKPEDLQILAISVDDSWRDINALFKQIGPPIFEVLLDREARVMLQYGTRRIPETYIIDKEGKIAKKIIGAIDWTEEDVKKMLQSILVRGLK